MARTKQTARKSTGGKAPRKAIATKSASAFRAFMTGQQAKQFAGKGKAQKEEKTSYLNYENMFYSYGFKTGQMTKEVALQPQFVSACDKNPITKEEEIWLGMTLNSKYDGDGMKKYGRPDLNLVVVLDISGSMGSSFSGGDYMRFSGTEGRDSKIVVAKKCLLALLDQLRKGDKFGLVLFNDKATVVGELKPWSKKWISEMKEKVSGVFANGMTDLSTAAQTATDLYGKAAEGKQSSNRVIFFTDLNSTVDSANDEKRLLATLKKNAASGIYTTVVGIGMDLNVELVTQISKTKGARYCSVDSAGEFETVITKEFPYDVTMIGFDIGVSLSPSPYAFCKGYGSPELNDLKPGKPVVLSSEFPSPHDENGEAKGGILLFKIGLKKGQKAAKSISGTVSWKDPTGSGISQELKFDVPLKEEDASYQGTGIRKAIALVRYVDLHNEYVLDKKTHSMKYLELFQKFRDYFVSEMSAVGDASISKNNKGDMELLDKIIELEGGKGAGSSSQSQDVKPIAVATAGPRSHKANARTKRGVHFRATSTQAKKTKSADPPSAPRRSERLCVKAGVKRPMPGPKSGPRAKVSK